MVNGRERSDQAAKPAERIQQDQLEVGTSDAPHHCHA